MSIQTTGDLTSVLCELHLLPPEQEEELVCDLREQFPEKDDLIAELLRREWLTQSQVDQLLAGKGQSLILAHFIILDTIGRGGMGEVLKARHEHLDRLEAIKIISSDSLEDQATLARFHREMKAVAQLNHPNIVRAHHAGVIEGTYFLAMEYLEGITLHEMVFRGGPLPIELACNYVRQVALGLQHAHERGLVHRDLKPSNLIATYSEEKSKWLKEHEDSGTTEVPRLVHDCIKIVDFGLARLHEGSSKQAAQGGITPSGMIVGTPDYISPEQINAPTQVGTPADLFSLGSVLYFLLTGRPPFSGDTLHERLNRVVLAERDPIQAIRPEVPDTVVQMLDRMLQRAPSDRFSTAQELAEALEATGNPIYEGEKEKPSEPLPKAERYIPPTQLMAEDDLHTLPKVPEPGSPQLLGQTPWKWLLLPGLAVVLLILAYITGIFRPF